MIVDRSIVPAASTDMQEARAIPFSCMFRWRRSDYRDYKWYRQIMLNAHPHWINLVEKAYKIDSP